MKTGQLKLFNQNLKAIAILISFLWLFFSTSKVKAQQDTITYSVETPDSTNPRYDQLYKIFLADKTKETKQLWKVDLFPIGQIYPNLTYEYRIGENFSLNTGVIFEPTIKIFEISQYRCQLSEGFRYYYNLKKRERLAKRTSGFSGNFFELEGIFTIINEFKWKAPAVYYTSLSFNYGLQRRIGNFGFIEPKLGYGLMSIRIKDEEVVVYSEEIKNRPVFPYVVMKLQIGFAISSFKNLNHIK